MNIDRNKVNDIKFFKDAKIHLLTTNLFQLKQNYFNDCQKLDIHSI